MERVIFFESNEGRLHRCIFAGLDNNCRPQWVKVDQGDEMMTLQDYMESYCLKSEDMRVLCLDGEELDSMTVALLFGAVLQGYPVDNARALEKAIKSLRNMGIGWKQEKLQLEVRVYEYYEQVNDKNEYRFCVACRGAGYLAEVDSFFTMKELMGALRCYFDALEKGAGIGLRKDLWSPNVNLLEVLEDEDIKMFDKIEQR